MRLNNIKEGYEVLPRMDREKYQERPGLEGPIMTRSGKVVYYDNKEGMYYDPDTDMYISYDDWKMLDSPNMHKVSEKDSIKPFDTISARAIRDLKQRYPHAKDPVNALVLDIEKNEMDSDRADDEADEERESIMSRIAKIEKELGMKEDVTSPGKDAAMAGAKVVAALEAIVKNKSAMSVNFMDGKSKVDLFTASAVLQVYNGVNEENKKKLLSLMADRQGFVKAAKIAFKMSENTEMKIENIKENQINEGVLDDTDEDGWMAKSQLYKAAKYAIKLHAMISDQDNLEPWVQAKITKASDYLQVVKHYMEYEGMNPYPMEGLQEDNEEATAMADHYFDMAKQDDANDGMDGSYFRQVARAVFRGDPQEMRDIILDGDTEPRERVLDHMARNHPDMLRKIFPKDADNASYLATMREAEEKHYMCVHAKKGTHKCTADSTYAAAKKAAKMWNMNSTAGIDVKLMDEPQTATEGSYGKKKKKYEGHSPHKKGTAKYKKHMAAMHANSAKPKGKMIEGMVKVTNIKWDSDDDVSDLSTTMMVPVPSGMDKDGAEEFIADYITDKTGVTHDGFKIEESKSQGDAWYIEQDARRMAEKDGHDWTSMPYGRKSVYRSKAAEMRKGDDEDMYENTEKQLEKQAIDFFTSIKSKINTTGGK